MQKNKKYLCDDYGVMCATCACREFCTKDAYDPIPEDILADAKLSSLHLDQKTGGENYDV